jgi:hypothetical protein
LREEDEEDLYLVKSLIALLSSAGVEHGSVSVGDISISVSFPSKVPDVISPERDADVETPISFPRFMPRQSESR